MIKLRNIIGAILIIISLGIVGCSSTVNDQGKVENALEGNVVEVEGQQDQYGWFPHMRLTFNGDTLVEVYFDYVDDAGSKKSQDEEYNAGMKEKTGVDTKEAMLTLRENLLQTQSPNEIDVIAGATQTSVEFVDMANQAFNEYFSGHNSANNYGDGDPSINTDDTEPATPIDESKTNTATEPPVTYESGGDGSPNSAENSENKESSSEESTDSEGSNESEKP